MIRCAPEVYTFLIVSVNYKRTHTFSIECVYIREYTLEHLCHFSAPHTHGPSQCIIHEPSGWDIYDMYTFMCSYCPW